MAEHIIPKGELTKLEIVSTGGSLYLTGWNRDEIHIKDLSDQDLVTEKKKHISLVFVSDAVIHVPHSLEVEVQSVGSDAFLKGISANLKISSVGGDLSLIDVSSVVAGSIGGDLIANRVQGDLRIENTGGDGLVENLQGQISLQNIGGDVNFENIGGGIEVKAGGDAQFNFNPVPWQAYQINTGGDISGSVPADCSVDLTIHSEEKDITVMVGDIELKIEQKDLEQQLGVGGPALMLNAGGKVFLTGDDFTWLENLKINTEELEGLAGDFSAQTAGQIKSHLGNLEQDLKETFLGLSESLNSIGISEENLQRITSQIEESSRQVAQKAELAAVKAQAKVEKKYAKARRKASILKTKSKEFDLVEFLAKKEEKKSVSEDERILILNMLQEKKISPEEANDLLQALEGKKES